MLVELSVMEQRYHAVMEVVSGAPVTEVACPQRTGGGLHLTELKSDKSRRTIALPPCSWQRSRPTVPPSSRNA